MNDQTVEALARANFVRLGRAQIKKEIREGAVSVVDVLEALPDVCGTMTIMELLTSQMRWGRKRVLKLLAQVPMRETRQLENMTERERAAIVSTIDRWGSRIDNG